MRSSRQLIGFGVGVLIACNHTAPGVSQEVTPNHASPTTKTSQPAPSSSSQASSETATPPKAESQTEDRAESVSQNTQSANRSTAEKATAPAQLTDVTTSAQPSVKATAPGVDQLETEPVSQVKSPLPEKAQRLLASPTPPKSSAEPVAQGAGTSAPTVTPASTTAPVSPSTPAPPSTPLAPPINTTTPAVAPPPSLVPGSINPPASKLQFLYIPNSSEQPIGPAKPGFAPNYLNPPPNPLYFPTKPAEVQLRGIQPITLEQAIELAKRNSPDLQVSIQQLERTRAVLREQQAANFPSLTVQAGLNSVRSPSGELQIRSIELPVESANFSRLSAFEQAQRIATRDAQLQEDIDVLQIAFSASATLSYDLYTSGLRPAQIRAAEQQVRSAELQVEITLEDLRLNVANDYYNLQQADEAVRINAAAVRAAQQSLRDAQALERAGLGTRFDVLRSQVQLANTQQDLTNSFAQQEIARRQLAQRISLSPAVNLAAADPVALAGSWGLTLEDTIVLAFKNRAELEQLLAQRAQSEQQRRAALAALGPTVTLSAQYDYQDPLNDIFPGADGYRFNVGVGWTLFDGGAARARARQQEANIRIAESQFASTRDLIRFRVEQAYANLIANYENIGTTTIALEQAREALRLARLRFQAGVGTQTDVINAENDLTRAEGNRVTAILGYNQALATLKRETSNLPIPVRTGLYSPTTTTPAPVQSSPTPRPSTSQ
ncbi:TolC family protein [Pantanalinema sp. GBBB05]|uniref:TolC family protein n=1 Tax=Pantanalinema sp. GBBB05 TaxID=2604139 RepID=UPI001D9E50DF|nr:TolC family protein [Pantanalinema sp. GBBB05]